MKRLKLDPLENKGPLTNAGQKIWRGSSFDWTLHSCLLHVWCTFTKGKGTRLEGVECKIFRARYGPIHWRFYFLPWPA